MSRGSPLDGPTEARGRLRRLLFLVPWVSKHQGRPVAEVAQALGVSVDELLEDLEFLTLVGRPPFMPDDYVDIYVEDGEVYVDLDQRLSAPPRLTAAEGVALAAAAGLLAPAASETLARAKEKLEQVLPAHAVESFREMGRRLDLALEAPSGFATASRAIAEYRVLAFDYFTSGRGETEARRVQPWVLLSHRGQWYLQGHCLTRQGERLFRLDRMANLALGDERFTPPADVAPRGMPGADPSAEGVRVRFEPAAAAQVRERFGDAAREVGGGRVEVTVPGDSVRWLTRWVLGFGGDAVVMAPEWARIAVVALARESLD